MKPRLLDLFCGRGGWTKSFIPRGWHCTGVDLEELGYPGEFLRANVYSLTREFIDSFDGIVSSPPCEDFARAWLPWLRADKKPSPEALGLLEWSIALCDRPNRIAECSTFAARHAPGSVRFGSVRIFCGETFRSLCQSGRGSRLQKAGCGLTCAPKFRQDLLTLSPLTSPLN